MSFVSSGDMKIQSILFAALGAAGLTATMPLAAKPVQQLEASYGMAAAVAGEARLGEARFVQLWTDDPDTFSSHWSSGELPDGVTSHRARRGEMLKMYIAIDGCQRDRRGICMLQGTFQLRRPDGSPDGDPIIFTAWQGKAPPKGQLALSGANIGAFIGDDDPAGDYTASLTITDAVSRQSGTSTVTLTFTD